MRVVNQKSIKIKRWIKLIGLVCLINSSMTAQDAPLFRLSAPAFSSTLSVIIPSAQLLPFPFYRQNTLAQTAPPPDLRILTTTPKAYSYDRLGIFCKLDVQLDNALKMPVRFRLGTLETVNRKEGKWEAWSE